MNAQSMLLALAMLAAGLAGCLAAEPQVAPPGGDEAALKNPFPALVPTVPAYDFARVVDPDHVAHEVPALHPAGHGLELVGHAKVGSILPPGMRGSITQVDVWEGYAVVAGMEQGPAFVIVDLRSPMEPRAVSYAPTVADGWTARFSKDGQFVFYGCQVLGAPYMPQGVLVGSCRSPEELHGQTSTPGGVSVWDVSDKTQPKFVDFLPNVRSHNLYVQSINGTDWIFTNRVEIIKFDRETGKLSKATEVPGVHDVTVQRHPVTGAWLMYTGSGGGSFAIYDVDDPANPQVVLEGGSLANVVGWHDQVVFPYLVDGRALLALAGETGINPNGGVPDTVSIVDVTDPAHPALLSQWKPPFSGRLPWPSYTFSVHEMAATPQGQLAVSWYHAGAWVLDLSTKERQEKPAVLAAYQPNLSINVIPSNFAQTPVPLVPFVWSAAWDQRGYLVVPDMHTGVYVLRPEWGLHPMLDSGA